jgi:hypothetical protein
VFHEAGNERQATPRFPDLSPNPHAALVTVENLSSEKPPPKHEFDTHCLILSVDV